MTLLRERVNFQVSRKRSFARAPNPPSTFAKFPIKVPLLRGKRAGQRNGLLIDGARRFDSSEACQHGAFLDVHRRHMEEGLTVGWLRCQGAEDLKRFAVAPERPYEIAFPRQRFSHRNMMQGGPRSKIARRRFARRQPPDDIAASLQ